MDYSKFVNAVLTDDEALITVQVKVITRVLIKFLMVRLGASIQDAQDCAQATLLIAVEKIREGKLKYPDAIINYLFTTCKHEYFKYLSKDREVNYVDLPEHHSMPAEQLENLLEAEKIRVLEDCLDELKVDNKAFIVYWFEHPGFDASVVADHFKISVNNAWTKKHRVISTLSECVKNKLKL